MKYIVEVREPVPSNLDEIASKVAASFRIGNDKALALLRRAPGAMTKAVSEREADVVAGIFERAGLEVVKRPVEEPPARPEPAAPDAVEGAAQASAGVQPEPAGAGVAGTGAQDGQGEGAGLPEEQPPAAAEEPAFGDEGAVHDERGGEGWERAGHVYGEDMGGQDMGGEVMGPEDMGAGEQGAEGLDAERPAAGEAADVWDRPLEEHEAMPVDAFSRREGFEDENELDWSAAGSDVDSDAVRQEADAVSLEEREDLPPEEGIELDEDDARLPSSAAGGAGVEAAPGEGDGGDGSTAAPAAQAWGEETAGTPVPQADAAASADSSELGRSSRTPEMARASQTPETVRRSQTPETMRSTSTRPPASELHRGGLRRRVALSSILPALLTLVVMAVAMLVTVLPLLRSQQLARATDAARAEASTLEALTGGLPLDSQTLSTALVDLSRGSRAALSGDGVSLMVVTDATGAPVAGWYGSAMTPAALPPAVRQDVAGRALEAVAGGVPAGESFGQSLQRSWSSLLAMLGLGTANDLLAAAPVSSAGQAIGAVVMGVPPVSADTMAGNAFLTTVLVGLVPVLIAILVAMGLTRGLRSQITYLLVSADRIGHGDLEEPVVLDSEDELGQLARAIERMRVSLQEGLERLRSRR